MLVGLRRLAFLTVPSLFVVGCAANSGAYAPSAAMQSPHRAPRLSPRSVSPSKVGNSNLFYVTNYEDTGNQSSVLVYQKPLGRNPAPFRTISNGLQIPADPVLDAHGALYVPNGCSFSGTGGSVQVYAKGQSNPRETITNGINCPLGSAIDPSQNLYISNVYVYGSSYYHGTITVYPQGKTKPSETIQGPLKAPHGLALDSHQNLFVADPYAGASVGQVFEVAKGTTTPVPLYLNGLTEPIEVATDGSDNLYVSDNVENVVQIYAPGQTSPEVTLSHPNSGLVSYGICLDQQGHLFVINIRFRGSKLPVIDEYKNPLTNSSPFRVFTQDLMFPDGCAAKKF